MAQADFYILQREDDHSRHITVCRLVEKALRHGHRIHIHLQTEEEAQELDQWLWSFRPDSFIPHGLQQAPEAASAPVTLGSGELRASLDTPAMPSPPILINLAQSVPDFFRSFARIAEVVTQRPDILSASRDHFRLYRKNGYNITSHDLK